MSNTRGKRTPTLDDVRLGASIRHARVARGMSQEMLGAAIGTTFQQVQKYEKATNRTPATRLRLIAKALHLKVSDLMPDDGETEPLPETTLTAKEMELLTMWRKWLTPEQRMSLRLIVNSIANGNMMIGIDCQEQTT